jgi:branched-chain amino acid transport system substrate-binding protein
MTKLNNLTIFDIAIFIFVVSVCFPSGISFAGKIRGVSENEIRIGYIPDFTGPSARGCRGHLWGMENYFNEINAKGGIHGRKVKLVIQDGKYNPSIGIRAFKKLVLKEKVFAMIANMGSASVKAQLPYIEKHRIPLISPAVQSWWISHPPKKYVFSTMCSQGYCARVLIDYVVNELRDKDGNIGVLYVNTELGHESLREIREQAGMYGLEISAAAGYSPGSVSLSGQIAKLKAADVDYVFLCCITVGAVYACKEAVKLDWKPQFLLPGVVTDEAIFNLGRDALFYGKPPIGASEYFPISSEFPAKENLLKWLNADPEKEMISLYDLHGFTYAKTLVEGLNRAGRGLSVESLVDAMEQIKDWDNGGQAPISFGSKSRQGVTEVVIFQGIKETDQGIGRWEIIKPWTRARSGE